MTREESIEWTARIQEYIGSEAPVLPTVGDLMTVREFISRTFFASEDQASGEFLETLMAEVKCLSADDFEADPYIQAMRDLPDRTVSGRFTLAKVNYKAGELFAYDAPKTSELPEGKAGDQLMVPRIGYFPRRVSFPAVYEDRIPWMSICPSEMNTLEKPIRHAKEWFSRQGEGDGKLLVLGLGLGYYPFLLAEEENVQKIVIVEYSKEIIRMFEEHLLPRFPHKDRIQIIQADAFDYLRSIRAEDFDYVFADTWESQFDGAKDYLRIKRQEKRLNQDPEKKVGFSYWIEPQIRAYLENELG
ncbi:MAG: hypothetical protein J5589_11165 [Firmicutes bacterium]|nr:hypothetical protein [Bacillota bacterium]